MKLRHRDPVHRHDRRLAAFALVAAAALFAALPAAAQSKGEIRIAHVYSKTGPLEAYGKQTQTGFDAGPGLRHQRHDDGGRQEDRA